MYPIILFIEHYLKSLFLLQNILNIFRTRLNKCQIIIFLRSFQYFLQGLLHLSDLKYKIVISNFYLLKIFLLFGVRFNFSLEILEIITDKVRDRWSDLTNTWNLEGRYHPKYLEKITHIIPISIQKLMSFFTILYDGRLQLLRKFRYDKIILLNLLTNLLIKILASTGMLHTLLQLELVQIEAINSDQWLLFLFWLWMIFIRHSIYANRLLINSE